ncbi:sensor histidine kinase [Chondrinema litorale]|uniref:sensor histidine kinase n=1 Tax=Chondrinema litorale TaxID=2994555 RepID=UPI002542ABCB|nr:ATP-binding protein [Chondrinema litorale]UZR92291.1 ATP-binding protein [Chondrinema litorale]
MEKIVYNFNLNVLSRLVAFGFLISLLTYILIEKSWYFTPLFISILIVINVWNLFYYLNKSHRELKDFLESIRQRDFTHNYKSYKGGSLKKELNQAFDSVIQEFKKISIEKELQYQYLQTINEQTGAGIICINSSGDVKLINPTAKKLLNKPNIRTFAEVESVFYQLFEFAYNAESGEKKLIKQENVSPAINLTVSIKEFYIGEEYIKLIHIQNISSELEENEIESWQKLIRVLTHEILNSLTPVVSLSKATAELLIEENTDRPKSINEIEDDDIKDVYKSLLTVQSRSKKLINFVNAFRDISKLPNPQLSDIKLNKQLQEIASLLEQELSKRNIELQLKVNPEDLYLRADKEMFDQVLINLILNARDALEDTENPKIKIEAFQKNSTKIIILVIDNGKGISPEYLDQVFIPFFTTKRNGSGVGLSFSRQLLHLHRGNIYIDSRINNGSTIRLEYPLS